MKTEMLNLIDNVHLTSSTGYEARLNDAAVDVHKGIVVSEKPVWVKLKNGVINAKRLEVRDSGDIIRFWRRRDDDRSAGTGNRAGGRSMTHRLWLYALTVAMTASGGAFAQTHLAQIPRRKVSRSPAQSILQDQNQDQPVQIDAATLEVQDKNKMATFSGDVHVVRVI